MSKLAILDGDGILWNNEARMDVARFVAQKYHVEREFDWDVAFHPLLVGLDRLLPQAEHVIVFLLQRGYTVIILSSNPETTRAARLTWLFTQFELIVVLPELILKDYETDRYTPTRQWKAAQVKKLLDEYPAIEEVLFVDDEPANVSAVAEVDARCRGFLSLSALVDLAFDGALDALEDGDVGAPAEFLYRIDAEG